MRFIVTLSLLATALAFAGCTKGDSIMVNASGDDVTGITVSGTGEVSAPTDTGYLSLGVQVDAATVAEAREQAARAAEAVIASLTSNGLEKRDIQTTQLAIYPRYDSRPAANGEPRITGYTVTNILEIKVRRLDSFSKVVDDAVAAGGDAARVNGIRFGIEDTEALAKQARELAVKDARAKAEQLAAATGVRLGEPLAISEVQSPAPPIVYAEARTTAQGATPIEPGSGMVAVQVTVRWAIAR